MDLLRPLLDLLREGGVRFFEDYADLLAGALLLLFLFLLVERADAEVAKEALVLDPLDERIVVRAQVVLGGRQAIVIGQKAHRGGLGELSWHRLLESFDLRDCVLQVEACLEKGFHVLFALQAAEVVRVLRDRPHVVVEQLAHPEELVGLPVETVQTLVERRVPLRAGPRRRGQRLSCCRDCRSPWRG